MHGINFVLVVLSPSDVKVSTTQLGSGGGGTVFSGIFNGARVAVKVLDDDMVVEELEDSLEELNILLCVKVYKIFHIFIYNVYSNYLLRF